MLLLQFKMVPNAMMQRTKTDITIDTFLEEMKRVQDGYNAEGDASPAGAAPLLVCYAFAKRRTDLCGRSLQCKR